MTNQKINGYAVLSEKNAVRRQKFGTFLQSDPNIVLIQDNKPTINYYHRHSNASYPSPDLSPYNSPSPNFFMSPISQDSPYTKSPWIFNSFDDEDDSNPREGLIGSLVREEGHIYSLASSGGLLYTGSDSRNIRVWKNMMEFSGFKSSSGLVKAIVVTGDKIFTGHQDGKIRVWRYSGRGYRRVNNLPTTKDYIKSSLNPRNYVEVRRHRNVPWIRHYDAVSCLSLDEERGLLYSGSWDKTMKVWRLSDSKCLESVSAHDDALNSVVVGFDGLIFTGSADGTVKVWRRELVGKMTRHVLVETMLEQENAVTAVAVSSAAPVVYAGSSDGLVNFWERKKHFLAHGGVVRGHKLAVLCLATAGNLLLSGSADKTICVWSREEGGIHNCLSVLTGHNGPVKCLTVEEDRMNEDGAKGDQRWIVYSGSLDRSVNIWRVSENAPQLHGI